MTHDDVAGIGPERVQTHNLWARCWWFRWFAHVIPECRWFSHCSRNFKVHSSLWHMYSSLGLLTSHKYFWGSCFGLRRYSKCGSMCGWFTVSDMYIRKALIWHNRGLICNASRHMTPWEFGASWFSWLISVDQILNYNKSSFILIDNVSSVAMMVIS